MSRFSFIPAEPEGEGHSLWIPNTDVYISEDEHLIIEVELAGVLP